MPSLEDDIKRFAENARRAAMEAVQEENESDVKTVEVKGYNSDGKMIVKDGDETKTVKETGNVYLKKGTKITLDQGGSADTPERSSEGSVQLEPLGTTEIPSALFKRKNDQVNQQEVLARNIEDEAVYWIFYRPCRADTQLVQDNYFETASRSYGVYFERDVWTSSDPQYRHNHSVQIDNDIQASFLDTATNTTRSWIRQDPSGGYRTFLPYGADTAPYGFVHSSAVSSGRTSSNWVKQSGSFNHGSIFIQMYGGSNQASLPIFDGANYYMNAAVMAAQNVYFPSYGDNYHDLPEIRIAANYYPGDYTGSGGSVIPYPADISAWWASIYYPFDNRPYYYYQTIQGGVRGGWLIDFRDYFLADRIVKCDRIHNWNTKRLDANDEERVVNFSIFLVVTTGNYTAMHTTGTSQSPAYRHQNHGILGHYLFYTRLDLYSGDLQYKTVALPPNPSNGNDMCSLVTNITTNASTAYFPNGCMVSWKGDSTTSGYSSHDFGYAFYGGTNVDFGGVYLDWSVLFSNAYSEDWLSLCPFTMSGWGSSAADMNALYEFIGLNMNGLYLDNFTTMNAIRLYEQDCTNQYYPEYLKVTPYRIDFSSVTDIAQIKNILSVMTSFGVTHDVYNFKDPAFTSYRANINNRRPDYPDEIISKTLPISAPNCGELYVDQPEISGCFEDHYGDYDYCNYLGVREFQFHKVYDVFHLYSLIQFYEIFQGSEFYAYLRLKNDVCFQTGDEITIILNSNGLDGTYNVGVIDSKWIYINLTSAGTVTNGEVPTDGYAVINL